MWLRFGTAAAVANGVGCIQILPNGGNILLDQAVPREAVQVVSATLGSKYICLEGK